MRKEIIIVAILACLGILLAGRGITGYVVSQSCCFPPNCAAENLCPSANPNLESPSPLSTNDMFSMGGVLLLVISLMYIAMHHKN